MLQQIASSEDSSRSTVFSTVNLIRSMLMRIKCIEKINGPSSGHRRPYQIFDWKSSHLVWLALYLGHCIKLVPSKESARLHLCVVDSILVYGGGYLDISTISWYIAKYLVTVYPHVQRPATATQRMVANGDRRASEEDTEDHTAKSSVISNDLIARPRSPRVSVNVANDATIDASGNKNIE